MSVAEFLALGLLVFLSTMVVDLAIARYTLALVDVRNGSASPHRAALWSVVGWAGSATGFYLAVTRSMAFLGFEAAGLYVGTLIGLRRAQRDVTSAVRG